VRDGNEAVAYLCGNQKFANRESYPLPALMLLDIKMPGLDGFGVLTWLQERHEYDDIAVVVLTSSNLDCDISRAKALGADDYLVKPLDFKDLIEILKVLYPRWLAPSGFVPSVKGFVRAQKRYPGAGDRRTTRLSPLEAV